MEILQASQADLYQVSQYTGQALKEGSLGKYTVGNEKMNNMMKKILDNNGKLLVAKESDQITGWVLFGPQKDSITDKYLGFIYEIYILEDYRKKGYAKKLLEECTKDLRNQGLHDVSLVVYSGNKAIGLYKQLGFTENKIVMNKKL
ncbi:N-acetyltransferase family protein [Bacillus pumilus]|uniref:GNAT family N-acetyltransferase n=1 Tax=Bacillus pumilus TaxID=1408 RepID=UPI0034A554AC